MVGQVQAMIRLLGDGDPETVRLVKEQMIQAALESSEDFEVLADTLGKLRPDILQQLQGIRDEFRRREREEDFELLCRFFHDSSDIEPALWQLAKLLDDGCDVDRCRLLIEQWGRQYALLAGSAVSSRERVLALCEFMAGELKFRGNREDYYNPRNSILPRVIETRMGLPISLVLIYRMVALRAGVIISGVNLPGHFIARHADVIFDPFHNGRILHSCDVELIVACQGMRLEEICICPATPRQILVRVLANLAHAYRLCGDEWRASLVRGYLKILTTRIV